MDDELGVMGASKRSEKVLLVGVCDDENAVLRVQETVVSSGDVEGEIRTFGVGVLRVWAILDLWFLYCWISESLAYAVAL